MSHSALRPEIPSLHSPPPVKPGTSQQYAVEWLRHALITRALRPGQRVAQEEIAERIGVSVVPLREALRVLEQEGQLTYRSRRGYFVTSLRIADLEEIYGLREILEERAARHALPTIDESACERMTSAAEDCLRAAVARDVSVELQANRRFHFAILGASDQPHTMRLIQKLWDSTESYRALYYNSATERRAATDAHDRIIEAVHERDIERLVEELNIHRARALQVLRGILVETGHAEGRNHERAQSVVRRR